MIKETILAVAPCSVPPPPRFDGRNISPVISPTRAPKPYRRTTRIHMPTKSPPRIDPTLIFMPLTVGAVCSGGLPRSDAAPPLYAAAVLSVKGLVTKKKRGASPVGPAP